MKKIIFILLAPIFSFAQTGNIGIGTTTPSATLHVKTDNEYILRVEDGTNTDNNNFIITSSDNNGTFLKQQADIFRSPIVAILPSTNSTINSSSSYQTTSVSINLPFGRWAVTGTLINKCTIHTNTNALPTAYKFESTFADDSASIIPTVDIEGNTKGSTGGSSVFKGILSTPEKYSTQNGIIVINNTSTSSFTKTYYLIVKTTQNGTASSCNLSNYGSSSEPQNMIYAIPLLD